MIPLAQTPSTKYKYFFFILNYTTPLVITGFEQLSSSILPSYGWPKFALKGQIMPFLKSFELGKKIGFVTHNFGYRYASKSIQGSIESDFDLVFNITLSQKRGSVGWDPGPAKRG